MEAAVVRVLAEMDELVRAADVLGVIWATPTGELPMGPALLRALEHSGNYVAGAFVDGELIGASAAWLGRRGDEVILHSHITGVLPEQQGRDVGYALKQHQREWALTRGIGTIEWTFDPLIRRNAYFNLTRLGATIVGYEHDLYGEMRDAANAGEETDRAVVRWQLEGSPVRTGDASDEGEVILATDGDGRPVASESDAPILRAWIPEEYVRDRSQLKGWRQAVRESIGAALGRGYVGVHMTRDGWYTLLRG